MLVINVGTYVTDAAVAMVKEKGGGGECVLEKGVGSELNSHLPIAGCR